MLRELWNLNRQQWFDQEQLDRIKLRKLQRQVNRAWQHSPFYRQHFASADFHPDDLQSLSDLPHLPVATKKELLAAGDSFYCTDIDLASCTLMKSSGSSGIPIRVPFNKTDRRHRVIKELRTLFALGYKLTDRMTILRVPTDSIIKMPWMQKLGIMRRNYLSVFSDELELIAGLNESKPDVVYSYASSLHLIAEELAKGHYQRPQPKLLITSADVLRNETRKLLTREFGTEPIEFYGSIEFGWIAWQCRERSGYHINEDCLIVECLRDGIPAAPGQEGELVITNLHSDAAPLIRYSIGDLGVLSKDMCPCGRSLSMLASINGRVEDCFVLPDGRKVSSNLITTPIEEIPGIHQFQVIQESDGTIKVRVVQNGHQVAPQEVRHVLERDLKTRLQVTTEFVDSIPCEPSGKFKAVKSFYSSKDRVTDIENRSV